MVVGVKAKDLQQSDVDRIMRSGEGIAAMRAAIDDTEFGEDRLLDPEQQEEWRGHLTGEQMRRWVRRRWHGGERGFIADNGLDSPEQEGAGEVASASALRKAEEKGRSAASRRQPRTTNPYGQGDKRFEMWDAAWKTANETKGQG